jgi:soluble calcium-activated nucleotidase 1
MVFNRYKNQSLLHSPIHITEIYDASILQTKRDEYQIAVITDLDTRSKRGADSKPNFYANMKIGKLKAGSKYSIEWVGDYEYITGHNEAGRGMELSELSLYNGKLFAGDDRTGLVYELTPPNPNTGQMAVPRVSLMEGNGLTNKGFKIEWSTVKDGLLYVGSFGKEYTNADGSIKVR